MKKGRLLHFSPSMTCGGAEKMLVDLMAALAPDWEQALLLLYPPDKHPFFYAPQVQALGIPVYYLHRTSDRYTRPAMIARYVQTLRHFRPHIIHAHQWRPMEVARMFHLLFPYIPVVCTSHSLILDSARARQERRWQSQMAAMIAVSEDVAIEYRAQVPSAADRVVKIPIGIDTQYFQPGDQATARQTLGLEIPPGGQMALMLARVHPGKNQLLLFQAIRVLQERGEWGPENRLFCLGQVGDEDYAAQLRTYLHQEGLDYSIQLLPPSQNALAYYQACDFLLHPSQYESFGMVALESAACERPMLISQATNPEGLFTHGESAWICHTGSLSALVASLGQMLKLSTEAKNRLAQAARAKVLLGYTVDQMAKSHLQLYESLIY